MTVKQMRVRVENAEYVIGPVLQTDGTGPLLRIDRDEVLEELGNYEDDDEAPWQIDEPNSDTNCLTLKADRPAPTPGETRVSFGGKLYVCMATSVNMMLFQRPRIETGHRPGGAVGQHPSRA